MLQMYTKILKDEMKSQCLRFGICIRGKVSGDIQGDTGRWLLKKDDGIHSLLYYLLFLMFENVFNKKGFLKNQE